MEFALPSFAFLPDDAAVLQFVLNGVGYIGVWNGNPISHTQMVRCVHLESNLMAFILVVNAGDDDAVRWAARCTVCARLLRAEWPRLDARRMRSPRLPVTGR